MERQLKQVSLTKMIASKKRSNEAETQDVPSPKKEKLTVYILVVEEVYTSDSEIYISGSEECEDFTCPHCKRALTFPNVQIKKLHISMCKAVLEEDDIDDSMEEMEDLSDEEPKEPGSDSHSSARATPDTIFDDGLTPQNAEPSQLSEGETSGEEVHSSSSVDEMEGHPPRLKLLTPEERVVEGLMGRAARPKVEVVQTKETGRGVVARESISKGSYICEYKTSMVFSAKNKTQDDEHKMNRRGMYIMQTAFEVEPGSGRLCFDATNRFHHPGRYINHVTRGANVKPMKPQYMRGKWRVGFLALRDIAQGEELCFDYGLRTEEVWTRKGRLVDGKVTCGTDRIEVGERNEAEGGQNTGAKGERETADEAGEETGAKEGKSTTQRGKQAKPKKKKGKRRHVWCPIAGCSSGHVEKMTQHLYAKYCLTPQSARPFLKTKRFAPAEAVQLRLPNPYARLHLGSSRSLREFFRPGPSRRPQFEEVGEEVTSESDGGFKSGGRKGKGRSKDSGGGNGGGGAGGLKGGGRKGKGRSKDSGGGNGGGGVGGLKGGGRKGKGTAKDSGGRNVEGGAGKRHKEIGAGKKPWEVDGESCGGKGDGGAGKRTRVSGGVDGERFLKRFKAYLESPLGGRRNEKSTRQVVSNVQKYLAHIDAEQICPHALLDLSPVQGFIASLQEEGIGCSGILQRIDAHSLALNFLNFSTEEEGIPARVQRTQDFLRTLRKSFHAEKAEREREGIEAKAFSPPDLTGVAEFLSDGNVGEEFYNTAERLLAGTEPTKNQYKTCLAIVVGRVLYGNAQRPSAVAGALLTEYQEALKAQQKGVHYATIRVHSHKTGTSDTAKLVLSADTLKMLRVWEEVRDKVAGDSPHLFPDYKGNELTHLTRLVQLFAETRDLTLINPQTYRSAVELQTMQLPAPVQEAVTRSLSHSYATAQKHYRANDPSSSHLAFETIKGIVSGKKPCPEPEPALEVEKPKMSSTQKRRRFSQQETSIIIEFFKGHIEEKVPPLNSESERFLSQQPPDLFVQRQPHDIYDKVRNLIGRK